MPEFESKTVHISVPENISIGAPIYSAHARDRDAGANGVIRYNIVNNGATGGLFSIEPKMGHLTLTRHLDYETSQRHSLIITATDSGIPPLSANLTVFVEVQDINDNPPVFERSEYTLRISESLPINSQVCVLYVINGILMKTFILIILIREIKECPHFIWRSSASIYVHIIGE